MVELLALDVRIDLVILVVLQYSILIVSFSARNR
jgi:hypothetical protein